MATLEIPRNLAAAGEQDDDPRRREWMAALPATVTELAERWSLRVGAPFQPGGQCSWVTPAQDARGRVGARMAAGCRRRRVVAGSSPGRRRVVAGLLRRLWRESPPSHPFRPLQAMCDYWAAEFEHKVAAEPGYLDRML